MQTILGCIVIAERGTYPGLMKSYTFLFSLFAKGERYSLNTTFLPYRGVFLFIPYGRYSYGLSAFLSPPPTSVFSDFGDAMIFSSGVYFLKMMTDGYECVKKFIIFK